ncbi:MAG: hypothetical protein AAF961_11665 [Planctomycetota bacterium]
MPILPQPNRPGRLAIAYASIQLAVVVGTAALLNWWVKSGFSSRLHVWTWDQASVAIAHSQAALLAAWVAFCGALQPWRLLIAMAGCCGLSATLQLSLTLGAFNLLSLAYGGQPLITAALFLAMRMTGFEVRPRRLGTTPTAHRHYSLKSMFLWSTSVCVVFAMIRLTLPVRATFEAIVSNSELAVDCSITAAVAVVAMWAALSNQRLTARAAALILACGTRFAMDSRPDDSRTAIQWAATFDFGYPLLFVVWLTPLRLLGFRLRQTSSPWARGLSI